MSKVLFLHGLESTTGGPKPNFMSAMGHEVFNPALPKESFEDSVKIAQNIIDNELPDKIVGSSRGGAIAMTVDPKGAALVLIAPAWKIFGVSPRVPPGTKVLHCETDDIVPIADSLELANMGAELEICGKGHRMSDESALESLASALA